MRAGPPSQVPSRVRGPAPTLPARRTCAGRAAFRALPPRDDPPVDSALDRWIFLLLGLCLLAAWGVFAALREDLRAPMLKLSAVGAVAGLVSEIWYFRDYWRPPTLAGVGRPSLEDALFGFAVTGVGFAVSKVVHGRRLTTGAPRRYGTTAALAAGGFVALAAGTGLFGWNSIFVSSAAFLAAAAVMAALRPDLAGTALESALLLVVIVVPVYVVLFDVVSPAYWDRYWLLAGTAFGTRVLGNIPVTELLWYASWGALAGIGYEFTTGRTGARRPGKRRSSPPDAVRHI